MESLLMEKESEEERKGKEKKTSWMFKVARVKVEEIGGVSAINLLPNLIFSSMYLWMHVCSLVCTVCRSVYNQIVLKPLLFFSDIYESSKRNKLFLL